MKIQRELRTDAKFAVSPEFEEELSAREKKKLAMALSRIGGKESGSSGGNSADTKRRRTSTTHSTATSSPSGGRHPSVIKHPENDNVGVIESILDKREQKGVPMYLCRWEGLDKSYDSWELAEDILCRAQLHEFERYS
eukprot:m.117964 g.117964  ORF g.117964 m.117964 type:complete len:138 (-) comp10959_c0_seq5:2347-2760(-)